MLSKRQVEFLVPAFLICVLAVPFMVWWVASTPSGSTSPDPSLISRGELVFSSPLEGEAGRGLDTVSHIPLPDEVRGLYWTAVTATTSRADELLEYMQAMGLNTVVIDAKMDNGEFVEMAEFEDVLATLYDAGIYRIARIAIMRDSAFASMHPDVTLRFPGGNFWTDNTGSIWVDPAASEVANSAILLGRQFYEAGFDEIQYDYVRFASDGALSAIVYPVYDASDSKIEIMQRFFERVGGAMQEEGIPVSFDVFGMTFWSLDDYNIGQRLIDVLPYADFVSPMVYPSHYVDGFKGYANPALAPYEIVKMSLDEGLRLTHGFFSGSDEELASRFRPWLQDFDIGAVYTSESIEAQIQAARDAGASGWMLWNARNVYEMAQYLP